VLLFRLQLLDRDPLSLVGLMRYVLNGLLESVCFNIAVASSTLLILYFLFVAGVRDPGGFFDGFLISAIPSLPPECFAGSGTGCGIAGRVQQSLGTAD